MGGSTLIVHNDPLMDPSQAVTQVSDEAGCLQVADVERNRQDDEAERPQQPQCLKCQYSHVS
jgi:hypothetical protein